MARYRKYTRRNRRNKRNYKLSKANIYLNKSSRAQATQIAALNRKINVIARRDKPETKINISQPKSITLNSSSLASSYDAWTVSYPSPGDSDSQYIGDKFTLKSLYIGFTLEFYTNPAGYHNTESAGTSYRIFVIQHKSTNVDQGGAMPLAEILEYGSNTGTSYNARSISPFRTGITNEFDILYDSVGTITLERNQKIHKIYVPLKRRNRTIRSIVGATNVFDKPIYVYIVPSDLKYDADYKEYLQVTYIEKIAYTDA